MQAVVACKQMLKVFKQEEEDVLNHWRRFKGLLKQVEALYGAIEPVKAAERDHKHSKDADQTKEAMKDNMLACTFMGGSQRAHWPLLKNSEQDPSLGEGKCPATSEEALQVLTACEDQHGLNKRRNRLQELQDAENLGSSFAQKIKLIEKQVCLKCQKLGHKTCQ